MSRDRHEQRIVIGGASSLLGGEVKTVLEESRFAGWDLRLVDEEDVAGTLTEAAGEAALIQRIEEQTFHGARFAFLTGSPDFAKQCIRPAKEAGSTILDFSRASLSDPDATPWFPKLEALGGKSISKNSKTYSVFSAGAAAIAGLALALKREGLKRMVAVLFRPVSERGGKGSRNWKRRRRNYCHFRVWDRRCLMRRRRLTCWRSMASEAGTICAEICSRRERKSAPPREVRNW